MEKVVRMAKLAKMLCAFIVLVVPAYLSYAQPASAISVELAKKCRELAVKAHPTPTAGSKATGAEKAQRDYFTRHVSPRALQVPIRRAPATQVALGWAAPRLLALGLRPVMVPYQNQSLQQLAQQILGKILSKVLNAHKICRDPRKPTHHRNRSDHDKTLRA